jgi:ribokinase
MSGRVIVVGSLNVDLVVRAPSLPGAGETVTGGTFSRHHGGKGGNQAVAAARLGASVSFVGAVGGDELGREARAALAAEGVAVEELRTLDAQPTGVALIVVDANGENQIAVASGANGTLDGALVDGALARLRPGARDVILVGHEIPTVGVRAALAAGRASGAVTILNPAPAGGLDRGTLGLADVVVPNRSELALLARRDAERVGRAGTPDSSPVAMAMRLLKPSAEGSGPGAILVTMGGAGALLVRDGHEAVELPAPAVEAIDSTGAGDALNGALAAGLAAGLGLEDAARRAVAAASLSTTRLGAREGLPTQAQLDAFAAESIDRPTGTG